MRHVRGLLAALAVLWSLAAAAAPLDDFDFVTAKVAANYAGWETKTAGPKRAEIEALTARLRARVAADGAALQPAVEAWLAWFDDGHLRSEWAAGGDVPWRAGRRPVPKVLNAGGPGLPGLWRIDDRYVLAVVPAGRGYEAIVTESRADGWAPGDVKAVLVPDGAGYSMRYGAGDRTELRVRARLVAGGEVLDAGELGVWRRVQPDAAAEAAALRRWPGDDFSLTRVDATTLLLRLPSFGDSHAETVKALVRDNEALLAAMPNLIIDVRGNGGGSDFVYDPVLPLLMTRPIYKIGVEVRASPDNQRLRREVADRLEKASPDAAVTLRAESGRMAGVTGFIRREPPFEIVPLGTVAANPQRVAVLVDRAASAAEDFIMDARQSRKVVLMGQENSAGVIDFGETMAMPAPSGQFTLIWATTRSLRLPNDPVDPDGIAPDVLIPAGTRDPVAWAAAWLQQR